MEFLNQLDQMIEEKHLLKHPFYIAWSKGELTSVCLQDYAKEYYHHVKAFPTYLSALHSHTQDADTRREILQNLIDEEATEPNHPELWKNFALSLGVHEKELSEHKPSCEIESLIKNFGELCRNGSVAEGLATLYSYESQIPAICISKIEGLKSYYGLTNPNSFEYFTVHIHADVEHAKRERELLAKHSTSSMQDNIKRAVDCTLNMLWNFLSLMCCRHQICMANDCMAKGHY